MVATLTLLSRPGCHLCEAMETELRSVLASRDYRLHVKDVESRDDWLAEYGLRIPVLLAADGRVLCEARLDQEAVLAYVQCAGEAR